MIHPPLKMHHIGIACKDIEQCKQFIKNSMVVTEETETIFDELQNAFICLLTLEDSSRLELVSGEIVKDIIKQGMSYYHTCYSVNDIQKAIKILQQECKAIVISEPKKAKIFNGRLAAFLYTPIGILELLED
ncbi:MAG: VOC family protein [Nanoarchaeota archaeon]|nr:VOC family protein [Nanoarchaeota archaeon]